MREQQIPGGNDRKKCKCNGKSNDSLAFAVSHPSLKNKYPARVGHPDWWLAEKSGSFTSFRMTSWEIQNDKRRECFRSV
jgi:hypothetical protein